MRELNLMKLSSSDLRRLLTIERRTAGKTRFEAMLSIYAHKVRQEVEEFHRIAHEVASRKIKIEV